MSEEGDLIHLLLLVEEGSNYDTTFVTGWLQVTGCFSPITLKTFEKQTAITFSVW